MTTAPPTPWEFKGALAKSIDLRRRWRKLWRRIPGALGGKCAAKYYLGESNHLVEHCGHPTALWPFAGYLEDGRMILANTGRGFPHLEDAKIAVLFEALGYPRPGRL